MAERSVLIVDENQAFATMLKESLESSGDYAATVATTGSEALEAVVEQRFALTIVDMAISDVEPMTLIRAIREAKPTMRLMLIPLLGEELSEEARSLGIQGILTKPFFMGDLPVKIEAALSRRVARPVPFTPQTIVPPPRVRVPAPPATPTVERHIPRVPAIDRHLSDLSREIVAEAVLLTHRDTLLAWAGQLDRAQAEALAALVAESFRAAAKVAAFLGEAGRRFERSSHEGNAYRLYSLKLNAELVLSVALRSETPVGMIRYNLRRTADELAKIVEETA